MTTTKGPTCDICGIGYPEHLSIYHGVKTAPPLYDRLADLEALREVTEQLVVAAEPYMRHALAAKAETILRRLRGDGPPERDPADYHHERVAS